ncbi:MAG TPA: magnesium/cobalt transporter CorA [Pseudomonadales bacterium]
MLTSYVQERGRLKPVAGEIGPPVAERALWIDLVDPTDEERSMIAALFQRQLPDAEDVEEIEATARAFVDEDGVHVTSLFLHTVDGLPRNSSVAFTVSSRRMVTLREREIPAFRLLRMRFRQDPEAPQSPMDLMLSLFEIKIDDLADNIEGVYQGLESVSAGVLEESDADLGDALDALAKHEDTNGKVRLCLMDTQRALRFVLRHGHLSPVQAEKVRELLRDVDSLLPHNSFVFEKINFLMDAAQGFINIEQNQIIKIFSIAAVVFLPPTLVASIYGMNFDNMPELHWLAGYPWAIALMIASGIAPYLYFKRKGWL